MNTIVELTVVKEKAPRCDAPRARISDFSLDVAIVGGGEKPSLSMWKCERRTTQKLRVEEDRRGVLDLSTHRLPPTEFTHHGDFSGNE